VLCAGLYPNVVAVRHPEELYQKSIHGAVPIANDPKDLKFFINQNGERTRVFVHPRSVNFHNTSYESPWLVYLELMQTSKIYVSECTMASPYSLLLFGGEVSVDHEKRHITVGGWIKFNPSGAKIAVLIRELRRYLDQLLVQKIHNPSLDISAKNSPVLSAILRLLTTNGFDQQSASEHDN